MSVREATTRDGRVGSMGSNINNLLNMLRSLRPERYILPAAAATAVGYSLMNSYYTVEGGHRCAS